MKEKVNLSILVNFPFSYEMSAHGVTMFVTSSELEARAGVISSPQIDKQCCFLSFSVCCFDVEVNRDMSFQ